MTPHPWYVAARRANVGNFKHPHRTASDYIRLHAFEWLRVHGKTGRIVGYFHSTDDALLVIAAPKLYVALLACHEAIRYPRGVTESEWIILRKQVGDVVCTLAPIFDAL